MTVDQRSAVISELVRAADHFAARARLQEACRDRSRPGTGLHHQHAHSATLWRLAEQELRARVSALEEGPSGRERPGRVSSVGGPGALRIRGVDERTAHGE